MLNCWCITWPVEFKRLNTVILKQLNILSSFIYVIWIFCSTQLHYCLSQGADVSAVLNNITSISPQFFVVQSYAILSVIPTFIFTDNVAAMFQLITRLKRLVQFDVDWRLRVVSLLATPARNSRVYERSPLAVQRAAVCSNGDCTQDTGINWLPLWFGAVCGQPCPWRPVNEIGWFLDRLWIGLLYTDH